MGFTNKVSDFPWPVSKSKASKFFAFKTDKMAKDGQAALKEATEFAMCGAATLATVGIATGVLYNKAACDMNLSEWNIVNFVLTGAIAFTSYFATKVSPNALSLCYKILSFDCTFNELLSEGLLPASVSIGQALLPLFALIWSIHGLSGIRYGTCSATAPLLYGITATEMLIQATAILVALGYTLKCAGFTFEKLKETIMGLYHKIKAIIMDLFDKAVSALKAIYEMIVKHMKIICDKICECCKSLRNYCPNIPKCFTCSYW